MSLINYIEPVSIGSMFVGLGSFFFAVVLCVLLIKFCRPVIGLVENKYNMETKYGIVEHKMLDNIAKERGIDLDKELLKMNVVRDNKKSIREKLEEEMFKNMFPEDKEKTK
jgi:hypothetical protein